MGGGVGALGTVPAGGVRGLGGAGFLAGGAVPEPAPAAGPADGCFVSLSSLIYWGDALSVSMSRVLNSPASSR